MITALKMESRDSKG